METQDLANLIFPDVKEISYYEEKYKKRELKERCSRYTCCTKPYRIYAYRKSVSIFNCEENSNAN